MAWLVRYKCHQCGAVREPGNDSGWVRCNHCECLIAFDWQAWLASKEYRKYLSDSANGSATAQWAKYQALLSEGDALHHSGKIDAATSKFMQATNLICDILPGIYPREIHANAAYRQALVTYNSAFVQLQRTHRDVRALNDEMMSLLKAIDYRKPLPTVLKAVDIIVQQFNLALKIGLPQDPDNLPTGARVQVMRSQFAGGYMQMLSAENQLELLKHVYGSDAVTQVGDADADTGIGMFRDWACPACGLWSLQSRHVHEFTCMGCFFRKPVSKADDALPKIETKCLSCSAPLTLEAGQPERACVYCNSWVRRARNDNANDLDFQKEMMARVQENVLKETGQALIIDPLPAEGKPGMPVTPQTRDTLKLQGMARTMAAYQTLVPAAKLTRLLQRSFGVSSSADTVKILQRVADQAELDQQRDGINATLTAMRTELTS